MALRSPRRLPEELEAIASERLSKGLESSRRQVEESKEEDVIEEERIVPTTGTRVAVLAAGKLGAAKAEYLLGTVRYVGRTVFAIGDWLGIELDGPFGKNNGVALGCKYFQCKPDHGLFVRPEAIMAEGEERAIEFLKQHAGNVEEQLALLKKRNRDKLKGSAWQLDLEDDSTLRGEALTSMYDESLPSIGASVYVRVFGKRVGGTIRFAGRTKFADGNWLGIALESGLGKNNGSVGGVTYFQCAPKRGLFVRPGAVTLREAQQWQYYGEALDDEGSQAESAEDAELQAMSEDELRLEVKRLRTEVKLLKATLKEKEEELTKVEEPLEPSAP